MVHRSTVGFGIAIGLAACSSGGGGGGGEDVAEYVEGVSTADGAVRASFVGGGMPPEGAGPTLSMSTNAAVIPGGTSPAALTADAAFTRVVIGVDGVDGYYALDLPGAQTTLELVLTLSQELEVPSFDWLVGVGGDAGIGAYYLTPVSVVNVGTGDVQISLSWNTAADVDLHVVDPAGEEIYYAHRESASGGALDLDSNAACGSDGPRNENITWPVRGAPDGTYTVRVDYWSSCDVAATDFTVALNARDRAAQTMAGSFTGGGDFGGEGAGVDVATLVVGNGVAALAPPPAHRELGTFHVELAPGAVAHDK
jgi:hypothetical protein